MNPPIRVWKTDDPCPLCGFRLSLTDPGDGKQRYDCPLCGWQSDCPGLGAGDGGE